MEKFIEKDKKQKETVPEQSRIPRQQFLSLEQSKFSAALGQFLARHTEKVGMKVYGFVHLHWLGIINFHLLIFVIGALEAPLLLHLDQQWLSKIIYGFYGFFCHQEASRSFFIFGNQVAICSRCLSFYSAMLIFGLWISLKKIKPLDLNLALLLILPALVDVLLQALHITESTNLVRLTTGGLLGMAVSLYLLPRAQRAMAHLSIGENRDFERSYVTRQFADKTSTG
jgi:uncharacterized membrane protein